MAEQAYAYVTLIPVAKGFQSAIAKELSGVGGIGGSAGKEAGQSFSSGFGGALKSLATVAAGAFAAIGVGKFLGETVTAAKNLSVEFVGVEQVFGSSAAAVQEFGKNAAQTAGLSSAAALQAAKGFGVLATQSGLAQGEAAKFSTSLVQAAGDLASFNGTTSEEALSAISSALQGSTEPLRRYGIFLDEAKLKQAAFDAGITSSITTSLTPSQKALATQAYLMNNLGVAAGDFQTYGDSFDNSLQTATASLENMKAELGTALLPALGQLTTAIQPVIETLGPLLQPVINALIPVVELLAENLGPILTPVIGALSSILVVLAENMAPLLEAIMPLIDVFVVLMEVAGEILAVILPPMIELIAILAPIISQLAQAFLPLIQKLLPPFSKLLESILPLIEMFAEFLSDYIVPLVTAFADVLADGLIKYMGLFTAAFEGLQKILGPVYEALKPILDGLLQLAGIDPASLKKEVVITTTTTNTSTKGEDNRFRNLQNSTVTPVTPVTPATPVSNPAAEAAAAAAAVRKKIQDLIQDTKKRLIENRKQYNKAVSEANETYANAQVEISEQYDKAIANATIRRDQAMADALKSYTKSVADINENTAKRLADVVAQSMNRLRDAFRSAAEVNIADMFSSDAINKSVGGLVDGLRTKLTQSRQLIANAAKLASEGFSQTFIEQVVAAGGETGNELAEGILNSTPEQKQELKDLFNVIESEAGTGMDSLAQTLYEKNGLATTELKNMYAGVLEEQRVALAEQKTLYDQQVADIMVAFNQEVADAKVTRDAALLDAEDALNQALLDANTAFLEGLDEIDKDFKEKINGMKSGVKGLKAEIDALTGSINTARANATNFGGGLATLRPMATGGLVTGPTPALVGEAGPELVIPLDRFESMMAESSTGKTVNYYAAPNQSVDSEQALFQAMRRAKVVASW
jgi:phage-related protein